MGGEIENLVSMCQRFGSSLEYVQAGGGNASCKLNDRVMAIKASGFRMRNVRIGRGIAIIDYRSVAGYLEESKIIRRNPQNEKNLNEQIERARLEGERPSIETGFHALLRKYVLHTHPVELNSFLCSSGNDDIARILNDLSLPALVLDYVNPGCELSSSVYVEMMKYRQTFGEAPEILLLKNHGLIVNSDTLDETMRLHDYVCDAVGSYILKRLDSNSASLPSIRAIDGNEYLSRFGSLLSDLLLSNSSYTGLMGGEFYFPDQVVYCDYQVCLDRVGAPSESIRLGTDGVRLPRVEKPDALIEVFVSVLYILSLISRLGRKPVSLPKTDVDYIRSLESEKYRKSL